MAAYLCLGNGSYLEALPFSGAHGALLDAGMFLCSTSDEVVTKLLLLLEEFKSPNQIRLE